MNNALIIFIKNPVKGKVKTRLAATIGDDMALEIYKKLLKHTLDIVEHVAVDKFLFFSDTIEESIGFVNTPVYKVIQSGNNLGDKMSNAFERLFKNKYKRIIIIGTDCPGITANILEEAFSKLNDKDVVIGPAVDGGYYLIGVNQEQSNLFDNIEWSTSAVLNSTIGRCKKNNLSYTLLEELSDVDEEKDLIHFEHSIKMKKNKANQHD